MGFLMNSLVQNPGMTLFAIDNISALTEIFKVSLTEIYLRFLSMQKFKASSYSMKGQSGEFKVKIRYFPLKFWKLSRLRHVKNYWINTMLVIPVVFMMILISIINTIKRLMYTSNVYHRRSIS